MGTAALKCILGVLIGILGYQQHLIEKPIAALFCFLTGGFIFCGFIMDVIRMAAEKQKLSRELKNSPKAEDYPNSPAPSDLRIGKTVRAAEVERFIENIESFAEYNPDYSLSESEIIDNYLTDKKIWKYSFHPKTVILEPESDCGKNDCIKVMIAGEQVGIIPPSDSAHLLKAMKKGSSVQVVYCTIGGGPYKIVHEDVCTGQYNMQEAATGYSVTMSICEA